MAEVRPSWRQRRKLVGVQGKGAMVLDSQRDLYQNDQELMGILTGYSTGWADGEELERWRPSSFLIHDRWEVLIMVGSHWAVVNRSRWGLIGVDEVLAELDAAGWHDDVEVLQLGLRWGKVVFGSRGWGGVYL
jgi:hypothetical protein